MTAYTTFNNHAFTIAIQNKNSTFKGVKRLTEVYVSIYMK